MPFSTRSTTAIQALVLVASSSRPLPIKEIAERLTISPSYLEQIFSELRAARVIRGQRGPGGGYLLGEQGDAVTVYDILRAVGKLTSASGVGTAGDAPHQRAIRAVHGSVNLHLREVSLRNLLAAATATT